MASDQSRTRTWSVATSPRSPQKLPDEVGLLSAFVGKPWDRDAQRKFVLLLEQAPFFQGEGSKTFGDLSARERIGRAPKTFGFVRGDSRHPLEISPAGEQLVAKHDLPDLFLHQLLKWQYPSIAHRDRDYRDLFRIKPFLEVLRLIRDPEIESLSKAEIAIFCVPLIDFGKYEDVRNALVAFRKKLGKHTSRHERQETITQEYRERYSVVYADDIREGRIATREQGGAEGNLDTFLEKKKRNAKDYADAAIRYFRLTGLFTVSAAPFNYRLRLLPERLVEVDEILKAVPRDPEDFRDADRFFNYLGDPTLPVLPGDNALVLAERMRALNAKIAPLMKEDQRVRTQHAIEVGVKEANVPKMKDTYNELVNAAEEVIIYDIQAKLSRQCAAIDDVLSTFDQIADRKVDVIDRPLFFECNIWRSLVILNYGCVTPHFKLDSTGNPVGLSPAGWPDMQAEYDDFLLVIDVTVSTGATQYNMESEPVFRHVGNVQRKFRDLRDQRPVYGLFVAERLTPTIVTDFFARHRIPTSEFAGPVKIIPLSIEDFRQMLVVAKKVGTWSAADLKLFFHRAANLAALAPNETIWHDHVRQLASTWLDTAAVGDPPPTELATQYDDQLRILAEIQNKLWQHTAK